jgi:hypothetical protein
MKITSCKGQPDIKRELKELGKALKLNADEEAYAEANIMFCRFFGHRGPEKCTHPNTRRALSKRLQNIRAWGRHVSFQRKRDIINAICVWPDSPGERLTLLAILLDG